ncbi:MAG: hypothetical protein M1522_01540 [Actinobacteria bacterium]|nr:hypothetical protein [Actinomycetota bacterium]
MSWENSTACGGVDVVCEPCATARGPVPPGTIAEADQMSARQADPTERAWMDRVVGRQPGERKTAEAVVAEIAAESAEHPGFTREMWDDLHPIWPSDDEGDRYEDGGDEA